MAFRGRLATAILALALAGGCAGSSGEKVAGVLPFGKSSEEAALRKRVEQDGFPTASQSGVGSTKDSKRLSD